MSHAPPVPDAQRAPWPAHPAPIGAGAEPAVEESEPAPGGEAALVPPRAVARVGIGVGVGAAIGSAAIVAALLYVNYGRKR